MDFDSFLKVTRFEIQGASGYSLDKDRPYDGQPHTDNGKRGETVVKGLTMRDISDCIVRGFLDAGGIKKDLPVHDDIYNIDLHCIDSGAVIQTALCYVEKTMGIYPNIPELKRIK